MQKSRHSYLSVLSMALVAALAPLSRAGMPLPRSPFRRATAGASMSGGKQRRNASTLHKTNGAREVARRKRQIERGLLQVSR